MEDLVPSHPRVPGSPLQRWSPRRRRRWRTPTSPSTIRRRSHLRRRACSPLSPRSIRTRSSGASPSATPCVRTSVLSRGWRRRWESVPGLALSFPDGTPPGVVDGVLLCHTGGSFSRFAFVVDDASASGRWLVALSRRGVHSIDLRRRLPNREGLLPFTLHSSIFSCTHLVSLHLEDISLPPLPVGFAGFPVLEDLYLSEITLPPDREGQLQAIIHGSPLLRVLYLEYVRYPVGGCVIEAPNLHSLTLIVPFNDDWRFGELPCLHDACIEIDEYYEATRNGYSKKSPHFGELLARVAQVEELTLRSPWYVEVKIDMTPFTFYNLKSLELSMDQMSVMFCLLKSSPNLERLKAECGHYQDVNWELLSAQWTDGMCSNLQDVQINSCGWVHPMPFIKLILSKASRLHTLSLNGCPVSQDDPLNELLTCTRASAECQILFKDGLEGIRFRRDVAYG
ncbi:unnamed protein product [Urochloa decumbens]|uniref:F-box/LRR-repeat protein 15/At3g58940/PEG3-like LRR domain-containing protein n=1 Tax=Urochloa decumbens TaxID=240449 RepID=A0ABC9F8E1_9POAL